MKNAFIPLLVVMMFQAPSPTPGAVEKDTARPVKRTVAADDGLEIVCEARGQGETALLFLHGWSGDRQYWKEQVDVFAPEYRVVAIDQAGHGESGKNRKEWTVAKLAGDVGSVVKALDLKRVILVGHSMGGSIGLAAAARMPERIVAVVGVDTLQNAEFKMPEETSRELVEAFESDFKGALRTMFKSLVPESGDPTLMQWLVSKAEGQDSKIALALIRDLLRRDTQTLLQEANVPVRCINSAGGYGFFTPTTADINRKYADYKAVFIEDVGHYPMLEKPGEFNRQLRSVLEEFRN